MGQKYVGYLAKIFSIGMVCSSGGFNSLHNVVLVVNGNWYVDVKYNYWLLKNISLVSRVRIKKFDVVFTFANQLVGLLLQILGVKCVYKKI